MRQTAKRIGKKNDLRGRQQHKSLDSFICVSWINQQSYSTRIWNTPKKAMDEFEKIIAQSNKEKCVKEQMLIVYLGLVFEEAHHPRPRYIYEYSAFDLLEHFVKVCLPLIKKNNVPKEAPLEHPCLADIPTLGSLTGEVDEYYLEQAKNNN